MNDSAQSADPGTQKRRSTRIVQAVPITVTGTDALGQPFKERTTTVMVNCHGCKYQSKHYVPKNSMVTLEVPRPEAGQKRTTQGRVVWVQRPRTVRELFQIGLEFIDFFDYSEKFSLFARTIIFLFLENNRYIIYLML